MAQNKISNQLFVEKLRPQTLDQCILLDRVKETLYQGIERVGHIMMHSSAGNGKSSIARILAKGHDTLELNASLDNGIDIVREQIIPFITSASLFDENNERKLKVVILDEGDMSSNSFWLSMRPVLEKYSDRFRCIVTCNYVDKIPDPILSRFNVIQITPITSDEDKVFFDGYLNRTKQILSFLKISYNEENVIQFVKSNYPDMRSIIKKIQQLYARQATELTPDMLSQTFDCSQLFQLITTKPDAWNNYKALVADWSTKADEAILEIGKNFAEYLHTINPSLDYKIPTIIIEIANHQNMLATAIDKFIVLESLVFKLQYIIWQQL